MAVGVSVFVGVLEGVNVTEMVGVSAAVGHELDQYEQGEQSAEHQQDWAGA